VASVYTFAGNALDFERSRFRGVMPYYYFHSVISRGTKFVIGLGSTEKADLITISNS
jgi:hypothetical protein